MTTGKTTKVADDLIVQAHKLELRKQVEIDDGWKRVIIPIQHMFPNCQVKYKTNCTDIKSCSKDKEFWDSIEKKLDGLKMANIKVERQELRRDRIKLEHTKPPKGFEDDIKRAKKVRFE